MYFEDFDLRGGGDLKECTKVCKGIFFIWGALLSNLIECQNQLMNYQKRKDKREWQNKSISRPWWPTP